MVALTFPPAGRIGILAAGRFLALELCGSSGSVAMTASHKRPKTVSPPRRQGVKTNHPKEHRAPALPCSSQRPVEAETKRPNASQVVNASFMAFRELPESQHFWRCQKAGILLVRLHTS